MSLSGGVASVGRGVGGERGSANKNLVLAAMVFADLRGRDACAPPRRGARLRALHPHRLLHHGRVMAVVFVASVGWLPRGRIEAPVEVAAAVEASGEA